MLFLLLLLQQLLLQLSSAFRGRQVYRDCHGMFETAQMSEKLLFSSLQRRTIRKKNWFSTVYLTHSTYLVRLKMKHQLLLSEVHLPGVVSQCGQEITIIVRKSPQVGTHRIGLWQLC